MNNHNKPQEQDRNDALNDFIPNFPDQKGELHILHLEDDDIDHELIDHHLQANLPWAIKMQRAENKEEFLTALEENTPHLVLSDYSLPDYDGLSAYCAVDEKSSYLPFIIITGAMGEETAVDILREGVTDYILKKSLDRLAPSIRRAISDASNRASKERAEKSLMELNNNLQLRITEVERLHKKAERQSQRLEIQAKQLEDALNLQKTFLAETSHELRTPLTALLGYLRQVERQCGSTQTLQDANRVAENMTRLVNDLLQLSRGELVNSIERHFMNLGNLLRQVGRDYDIQADVPDCEIVGDPGRLGQVFVNLVTNAIRVSGSADKVRLEIETAPDLGEVSALVIDRGPGISDDIKPRIFDKFYRGKEAGSAGLGLTIAQQVVASHEGILAVEDTPGGGATFRVRLPLHDVHDDADDDFEGPA